MVNEDGSVTERRSQKDYLRPVSMVSRWWRDPVIKDDWLVAAIANPEPERIEREFDQREQGHRLCVGQCLRRAADRDRLRRRDGSSRIRLGGAEPLL